MAGSVEDPNNFFPERRIEPLPVGALGRPFGESVVIQGKVVEGPFKYESSLSEGRLLVTRINGVATQEGLVIRFDPVTQREWWAAADPIERRKEPWKQRERKLSAMVGKSYEMRGYEWGGHKGVTSEEFILQPPIQSPGFHFRPEFRPLLMFEIPEMQFSPSDFEGRVAEIEGIAATTRGKAMLRGGQEWTVNIGNRPWPEKCEGRLVWVKGRVEKEGERSFKFHASEFRLIHLEDQLGERVELDGVARSLNDHWWFVYRGTNIYVENQANLTGWNNGLFNQVVTISGTLEKDRLPDISQLSLKADRDLRDYFVVRNAAWKLVENEWRKPRTIPKAPPLTEAYLTKCGVPVDKSLRRSLKELEESEKLKSVP